MNNLYRPVRGAIHQGVGPCVQGGVEPYKSACNDSFYNGTPRIDRVFHFCGRTPLADFGWLTGTGLRTFKHITHLQDKPLATEKVTRGCF